MFDKVNLKNALNKIREEQKTKQKQEELLNEVRSMFESEWERDQRILSELKSGPGDSHLPKGSNLPEGRIYEQRDIQKLCVKYRLRFLSTKHFNKPLPDEAISAIKDAEKVSGETISAFMIAAPASMFKLTDANKDPLLFAPLADGRFYLLHQWGGDVSALRSMMYWPFAKLVNLAFSIVAIAALLSAFIPTEVMSGAESNYFNFYRFAFFAWNIIFLSGMVSYFWFATHQKFSVNAWRSPHFN